jgi:hypothetical protein
MKWHVTGISKAAVTTSEEKANPPFSICSVAKNCSRFQVSTTPMGRKGQWLSNPSGPWERAPQMTMAK